MTTRSYSYTRVGCSYEPVSSPFLRGHMPRDQRMNGAAGFFLMSRANRDVGKSSLDLVIDPCGT